MIIESFVFEFRIDNLITEQNGGLTAWHNKSQTHEPGAGAKVKRFYSGAKQPGRMMDYCLKDHLFSSSSPPFL